MYKELDTLLSANTTVDSWYDGCVIANEILAEFSSSDWEELSNQVLSKPVEWQRKLAYCLDNECNMYELNVLIALLSTDDAELFEICIDTLRSFTNQESKKMILDNPVIIQRVNILLSQTSSLPVKNMLQDFLSKIHS